MVGGNSDNLSGSGTRRGRRLRVLPFPDDRFRVVCPGVAQVIRIAVPSEEDHPVVRGVIDHPAGLPGGGRGRRGHQSPPVRGAIVNPGVAQCAALALPAEEHNFAAAAVICHRGVASRGG